MKYLVCLLVLLCACRGPKGNDGVRGIQGAAGAIGPQGIQGAPGVDASGVTVVKFCNDSANYPSTFPEYGLCIDNQVYAVYSVNDGFLALIPPGTYSSNAVGSSCTFTVQDNCEVIR